MDNHYSELFKFGQSGGSSCGGVPVDLDAPLTGDKSGGGKSRNLAVPSGLVCRYSANSGIIGIDMDDSDIQDNDIKCQMPETDAVISDTLFASLLKKVSAPTPAVFMTALHTIKLVTKTNHTKRSRPQYTQRTRKNRRDEK
jgi:hypothetical protein